MASHWDLLRDCIPNDHSRQVTSAYYLEKLMTQPVRPLRVLDLGCGTASSYDKFRAHSGDVSWTGVDIPTSQEARQRQRSDCAVVYFDGIHLPFADGTFDLVYSHQVLEHVSRPRELLAEVARAMSQRAHFIGSTSQAEPYHSHSLWNYTVYGFRTLVEEAGLRLREVRPSIDGVTLIRRAFKGRPPEWLKYFTEESPLNSEIDAWGSRTGRSHAQINNRKLEFCGQFAFLVEKS